MLSAFYGMADEVARSRELDYEAERLKRQIKGTWEDARFFGMPGVINLKDRPRPDSSAYVYIGRGQRAGKERFVPTMGNPYSVKRTAGPRPWRGTSGGSNGPLWDELPELEGKTLACWCKPEACHGDVLLRLVAERQRGDGNRAGAFTGPGPRPGRRGMDEELDPRRRRASRQAGGYTSGPGRTG